MLPGRADAIRMGMSCMNVKRMQHKRRLCQAAADLQGLTVWQVSLLDPVQYPGAIKAFAKEVCRNDLLNFGRLHFFFPDSRLALDLNTDKTLKASLICNPPCAPCSGTHPF